MTKSLKYKKNILRKYKKNIFKKNSKKIHKSIRKYKKGGALLIKENNNNTLRKVLGVLHAKGIKIEDLTREQLIQILKDFSKHSNNNNLLYSGAQPACCHLENDIKFVRVHGSSLKPDNMINNGEIIPKTFVIPDNTYVITITTPGEGLIIPGGFKDIIFDFYKKGYHLFEDNDKSVILSTEGNKLMYKYNNYKYVLEYTLRINKFMGVLTPEQIKYEEQKIESARDSYNFFFRNHIPKMIMNEIYLNFNDEKCDDKDERISCRIFCLNNDTKETHSCKPLSFNPRTNYSEVGVILLSDLISKEGPGIYIISACRNFEEGTPNNIKTAMRALST